MIQTVSYRSREIIDSTYIHINQGVPFKIYTAISEIVGYIDVGDEIFWRQLWDVGDDFCRFCHQNPLSLSISISVGHQHPKDVTNIEILTPTLENCHQHKITYIYLSSTSM